MDIQDIQDINKLVEAIKKRKETFNTIEELVESVLKPPSYHIDINYDDMRIDYYEYIKIPITAINITIKL